MDDPAESLGPPGADALAGDLRALVGKLRRRLREQAHVGDLTPSQKSALLWLERHGPATLSTLARAEGMRPQSMGAIVAALQESALVTGTPDPTDGRQTLLALTETCRRRLADGRAARQDWLSRIIEARLSPPERQSLAHAVTLLKRLVDD